MTLLNEKDKYIFNWINHLGTEILSSLYIQMFDQVFE